MTKPSNVARCSAALLAIPLLAGCSHGETAEEPSSAPRELAAVYAQAKEDPEVDESQLEILSGSSVTFQQYEAAINAVILCAEGQGLEVLTEAAQKVGGVEQVRYAYAGTGNLTDEQASQLHDSCYLKYAEYVDTYWQTASPQVQAFEAARAEALYQPMKECLIRNGADIADDASFNDLLHADTNQALERAAGGGEAAPVCIDEVGYDSWQG